MTTSSPPVSHFLYIAATSNALVFIGLPLYPQFRAWNVGTIAVIFWVIVTCLNGVANAGLWTTTAEDWLPGFCEFSIQLTRAATMGIPCATLAINRRFYLILRHDSSMPPQSLSTKENRNMALADAAIAFLPAIPYTLLQIPAHQQGRAGRRFDILEGVGCLPVHTNDAMAVSYVLGFAPPVAVGIAAMVYCFLCSIAGGRQRRGGMRNIRRVFSPYDDLSLWRWARTTTFAAWGLVGLFLPSLVLQMVALPYLANIAEAVSPAGRLHAGEWAADPMVQLSVEFTRWALGPIFAFFIFVLLGTGIEAFRAYLRLNDRAEQAWRNFCCGCRRRAARPTARRKKTPPIEVDIELDEISVRSPLPPRRLERDSRRDSAFPARSNPHVFIRAPSEATIRPVNSMATLVGQLSERAEHESTHKAGCDFRHSLDIATHDSGRYIFPDSQTGLFINANTTESTLTPTVQPNADIASSGLRIIRADPTTGLFVVPPTFDSPDEQATTPTPTSAPSGCAFRFESTSDSPGDPEYNFDGSPRRYIFRDSVTGRYRDTRGLTAPPPKRGRKIA